MRKTLLLMTAFASVLGCEENSRGGGDARAGQRFAAALHGREGVDLGVDFLMPEGAFTTPLPKLKWSARDDAALYQLSIDDSEECTSPLQQYSSRVATRQLAYLENGSYFACLKALSRDGRVLAEASSTFDVAAKNAADPNEQNAFGGSGAAMATPDLYSFLLPMTDEGAAPSAFGAYADPAAEDRLKFFINDRTNRRVLVYDRVPVNGEQPMLVVGQADASGGLKNGGKPRASAAGFADNVHVSVCPNGRVLVTDRGNNRVMVYRHIPDASGRAADLVIGQPDFSVNRPGASAASLNQPAAAYCIDNRLVVLDKGNNRLLVFNRIPDTSGASADYVVGQSDFQTATPGCDSHHFNAPSDVVFTGDRFYVADSGNNRVVAFDGFPAALGAEAKVALGQPSMNLCRPNQGGNVAAQGLKVPSSLAFRDGVLAVGDPGNHRIVFYFGKTNTGMAAGQVLGQRDLESDRGALADAALASPKGLVFDGDYLWVGDQAARRIEVLPLPW